MPDSLLQHLRRPVTFAYRVGWRLGEICTLTWEQVDLKQNIVRLEPGEIKIKEGRTIYLDDELKPIFRKLRKSRKRLKSGLSWVFLNEYGTDRIKRFDKAWRTACKSAGIHGKTFTIPGELLSRTSSGLESLKEWQ